MDKIRTFVGVLLPADVRCRLYELERRLIESGADVKWVAEENFHITLKFLGQLEPGRLEAVFEGVRQAAESTRAFDIALAGTGAFPKPSRPSVIWVGVKSGSEELRNLANRVESTLEKLGFAREPREFSGHVTLGRVKSPRASDKLHQAIEQLREETAGQTKVRSVAVMKSELYRTGPVYTALREFQLG